MPHEQDRLSALLLSRNHTSAVDYLATLFQISHEAARKRWTRGIHDVRDWRVIAADLNVPITFFFSSDVRSDSSQLTLHGADGIALAARSYPEWCPKDRFTEIEGLYSLLPLCLLTESLLVAHCDELRYWSCLDSEWKDCFLQYGTARRLGFLEQRRWGIAHVYVPVKTFRDLLARKMLHTRPCDHKAWLSHLETCLETTNLKLYLYEAPTKLLRQMPYSMIRFNEHTFVTFESAQHIVVNDAKDAARFRRFKDKIEVVMSPKLSRNAVYEVLAG